MQERLQKILAQAGVASRRKAEELIVEGRVTVNGVVVTELGQKANPKTQRIAVDGKPVELERTVNLILHKPTSYVTTVKDPEGRRTVLDLLTDVDERVYPVGRLDYDTSGLLLLSNDGDLTQRLLHPSFHADKVYRATVVGMPEKAAIAKLRAGIQLDDGTTAPADVTILRHHPAESVLEMTIHEGRNRQVRRMLEAIDYPVKRLKRIQFGPLELGNLPPGSWRWLTREEWNKLYESADLPAPDYFGGNRSVSSAKGKPQRPMRGRSTDGDRRNTRGTGPEQRSRSSEAGRKATGSRPMHGRTAGGDGRTTRGTGPEQRSRSSEGGRKSDRQGRSQNGGRPISTNKGTGRGSTNRNSKKR